MLKFTPASLAFASLFSVSCQDNVANLSNSTANSPQSLSERWKRAAAGEMDIASCVLKVKPANPISPKEYQSFRSILEGSKEAGVPVFLVLAWEEYDYVILYRSCSDKTPSIDKVKEALTLNNIQFSAVEDVSRAEAREIIRSVELSSPSQ